MKWRVRNEVSTEGVRIEAWTREARKRLDATEGVIRAMVDGQREEDEVDEDVWFEELAVDVVIEAASGQAAGRQVMAAVLAALTDVSEGDVGWSSAPWHGEPIDDLR